MNTISISPGTDTLIRADVEPPLDYKTAVENMQGWMIEQGYNTSTIGEPYGPLDALRVDGLTDDGFLIWFQASETFMKMDVFAGPYWGNAREVGRLTAGSSEYLLTQFEFILPYEHLPFPEFRGDSPHG